MGRIQTAYESGFRQLLASLGARRLEQGVGWLFRKALAQAAAGRPDLNAALGAVHRHLTRQVRRFGRRRQARAPLDPGEEDRIRFVCDAGLGGLARWLRAAGYDAWWAMDITDTALIEEARRSRSILLTTDSLMMDRRVLREGVIRGLWVPPSLSMLDQLGVVLEQFGLGLRPSRCMACGGELKPVEKETVRDRIPPKTYLWRDEYFVCGRCDKLFWHGTHWTRIQAELRRRFQRGPV